MSPGLDLTEPLNFAYLQSTTIDFCTEIADSVQKHVRHVRQVRETVDLGILDLHLLHRKSRRHKRKKKGSALICCRCRKTSSRAWRRRDRAYHPISKLHISFTLLLSCTPALHEFRSQALTRASPDFWLWARAIV